LDSLWPDTPVFLLRIDGHAALVNSAALKAAAIDHNTTVTGGEIRKNGTKLTGLLIDAAVDLVYAVVPKPSPEVQIKALLEAQKDCFGVGLTHVTDAGIENAGLKNEVILRIDSLQRAGALKMRMNIMADLAETALYFGKPKVKTSGLSVTGFKMYADGALGSRGACLRQPYTDQKDHFGFLIGTPAQFDSIAQAISTSGYQLNTHCIGDSSHHLMLQLYDKYLKGVENHRWRIEHAQVIDPADLHYYKENHIIPSVQPVHATSDMYWAEARLGPERVKGAYAYKSLLEQSGMVAAGSDFPVEYINPLFGFYAAVTRKDQKGFPENGFQKENALTREQALRAMTIWAAFAAFNEHETGSLEPGKYADFVILDKDLMTAADAELWNIRVLETYLGGEKVYGRVP
jgi:predicted amidohydrolase YtcJ